MTNRLIHETSPYLRQHSHNPVDWFPWGEEALRASREADKPIFLSIGYSACHWCHVMERESFEDPAVAQLLRDNFISIKVDREERPALDQIYMAAVQVLTQHGGWPMSVWLTPDLKPYYGGTYFPPRDLYGRPSFSRVLMALAEAWNDQRDTIHANADRLTESVKAFLHLEPGEGDLGPDLLRQAGKMLARRFDAQHGGFGAAPKFPHPMELRLLLRIADRFGDDDALDMARKSFDQMARGGIYDQLGGGFHRYSTDAHWLVPHFEKMLYDNALLVPGYVEFFQVTGKPFYRGVAEETLEYVLQEMTDPQGAFYSAQDADSEGEEGKFFVWSSAEVETVLGKDDAAFAASVYNVAPGGNWEGVNIPHRSRSDEQDARLMKMDVAAFRERLERCRAALLQVRGQRVWPGRDEKILTAWNGLMIAALSQAGAVLGNDLYLTAARQAADFLLTKMRTPRGRLLRTTLAGMEAKLNGYLEDYSYLIDALVALYEATFEPRWLTEAVTLAEVMIEQFWDAEDGGFFYTSSDHEALIARNKDPRDNAIPSGNSMAVIALLRLAHLTGRDDFRAKAEKTLDLFQGLLAASPLAAGQMLIALDFHLGPVREIAMVGDPTHTDYVAKLRTLRASFAPRQLFAGGSADIPLLANRPATGPVTVYLCENGVCQT